MSDFDARISQVESFITEAETRLRVNPDDFAAKLSLGSLRAHAGDLRMQNELAKAEQLQELVEVRLIGNRVRFGSVPLAPLSSIVGAFAKVLNEAVLKLKFGIISPSEKSEKLLWVERLTDLRLAGLAEGSARLFVTGKMTEDLAGETLLRDVLSTFFGALNAQDPDSFYDMAHAMGSPSSAAIEQMMSALAKFDLAADIAWIAPNGFNYRWEGRTNEIYRLKTLLENVSTVRTESETVTALVSLISDNGRLELRVPGEDRPRKVRYARSKYEVVRGLNVGDSAQFILERSTLFDRAQDKEIAKFSLVDVADPLTQTPQIR